MSTYPNIIAAKDARIAELEAEVERLTAQIAKATDPAYLEKKLRQIGITDDMATEALSALEPAAPEGQQEPVATVAKVNAAGASWNTVYPADALDKLPIGTPLYTRPSEQAVSEAAMSEAEAIFADYFRRNYPGPDTIIGKPDWHSPKIFRAALHALRSVATLKAAMEAGR